MCTLRAGVALGRDLRKYAAAVGEEVAGGDGVRGEKYYAALRVFAEY